MCQRASHMHSMHEFCGREHTGHHVIAEREHHYGCCYGHHGHELRHFPTKEETIARMEEYLSQLQAEARGVEERLSELRGQAPSAQ